MLSPEQRGADSLGLSVRGNTDRLAQNELFIIECGMNEKRRTPEVIALPPGPGTASPQS